MLIQILVILQNNGSERRAKRTVHQTNHSLIIRHSSLRMNNGCKGFDLACWFYPWPVRPYGNMNLLSPYVITYDSTPCKSSIWHAQISFNIYHLPCAPTVVCSALHLCSDIAFTWHKVKMCLICDPRINNEFINGQFTGALHFLEKSFRQQSFIDNEYNPIDAKV